MIQYTSQGERKWKKLTCQCIYLLIKVMKTRKRSLTRNNNSILTPWEIGHKVLRIDIKIVYLLWSIPNLHIYCHSRLFKDLNTYKTTKWRYLRLSLLNDTASFCMCGVQIFLLSRSGKKTKRDVMHRHSLKIKWKVGSVLTLTFFCLPCYI